MRTLKNNTSPYAEKGVVEQVRKISEGIWDMTVLAPKIAGASRAGQFVHVRVSDGFSPFLRRPLSVGPARGDFFRLIFTVRGSGTRLLAAKEPGGVIDLIGPLGRPFIMPGGDQFPILVAGGIGVVPLLLLDNQLSMEYEKEFLLGISSVKDATLDEVEVGQRRIQLSSDDGSVGFHGNTIELLMKRLDELNRKNIVIYGCGPGPMLYALKKLCQERSIPAYVSLEVPMGCGVGACQSCAVPRADGGGYYLVCHDGPVFNASDVELQPGVLP